MVEPNMLPSSFNETRQHIIYIYLCRTVNSLCLTNSWNFKIFCSVKILLVCDLFLTFKMYLTERFCNEQILFMRWSVELPQASVPYVKLYTIACTHWTLKKNTILIYLVDYALSLNFNQRQMNTVYWCFSGNKTTHY